MADFVERMIEALKRGRQFVLRDVWRIGLPGEEVPGGFIIKQIRVVILLITNIAESSLMLRAAALTFSTTLCIVPFLAIMFYVIQTFNLGEGVYQQMQERLEEVFDQATNILSGGESGTEPETAADAEGVQGESGDVLSGEPDQAAEEIVVAGGSEEDTNERAPPEDGADEAGDEAIPVTAEALQARSEESRELQNQLLGAFFRGVGQQGEDMTDPVEWLAELANEAATDPRALSVAGILLVFTTIFGLMRNLEKSFNDIWGVKRTRSWYRMTSDYVMIILLLPFVAAGVLGLTAALQSETIMQRLGPLAYSLQAMQYLAICLVFASLYYVVPNARVKTVYALLGGLVAGFLWVMLSWSYVEFQVGLAKYNVIFSTFAQFPMLLMWVYLSWGVLLFGAEISFAYQNEKTFAMERFADRASFAYREALGLRTMLEAGRRFAYGLPALRRETAAEEWNVPSRLVHEALDHLEEAGLITPCATEPITYQPSKPLDQIAIGDVLTALREVGEDPSLLRDDAMFKPFYEKLADTGAAFEGANVAELVERLQASLDTIQPITGSDCGDSKAAKREAL